jgi:hypothetical protein
MYQKSCQAASSAGSSESPLRDAAMLCKDWGLDRWYTKYLFDQATHSREKLKAAENAQEKEKENGTENGKEKEKGSDELGAPELDALELSLLRDSCTDLAPFLENPALIIGMLASASSTNRGVINQQLGAFLEKVNPKNLEAVDPTDKRAYSLVRQRTIRISLLFSVL